MGWTQVGNIKGPTGTSTVAGITDAGATGKSVLLSATSAAAKTALGLANVQNLAVYVLAVGAPDPTGASPAGLYVRQTS